MTNIEQLGKDVYNAQALFVSLGMYVGRHTEHLRAEAVEGV